MNIQFLLGQKIKKIRLEKGISQEELAELSSLHRTYISSVELGKRNISIQNIKAIADALKVPIHELLTFK